MADGVVNKTVDPDNDDGIESSNSIDSPKVEPEIKDNTHAISNFNDPVISEIEIMASEISTKLQQSLKFAVESRSKPKIDNQYIPGPLPPRATDISEILPQLENLILYDEDGDSGHLIKNIISVHQPDSIGKIAIMSHSLAAFISMLNPINLRRLTSRIVSDIDIWISRLFRFFDNASYIHEDPREGLLRICRMCLYLRYPKFAISGYEALYPRPPVIYISAAAKSGLGHYICTQLGLPLASLSVVPCNTLFGSNFKMDIAVLEAQIQDDLAAQRVPMLLIANAGTPIVGHVDNLTRLQEICRAHDMWLHVEGHSLAALCLASLPNLPVKCGDSVTLPIGIWLGIPAVPYITLFKAVESASVIAAGLTYNLHLKLSCLPLWISLQSFGAEGIVQRIQHAFELSKYLQDKLSPVKKIKLLSQQNSNGKENGTHSNNITDLMSKPVSISLLLDVLPPTVVFQYVEQDERGENSPDHLEPKLLKRNAPYYDNLNSWLGQILQRDIPRIHLDIVDLDTFGICIRFCPLESAQVVGSTRDDVDDMVNILIQQLAIMNATVKHKNTFKTMVDEHPNLQIVEIANWAGLGGLRYLPNHLLSNINDLPDSGKEDINKINKELVLQLKNTDSAFSIGEGEDNLSCVRFGMVTEETDMDELINLVLSTGKSVEESSKYMETMAEMVKKGIETAKDDLKKENDEKIWQEGILRQVPLVGTFVNWWSPLPKETGIKGRSFNIHSGVIESTENIYRYHMQIEQGLPEKSSPATPRPSIQMPVTVSPQHSRSSSKSSISSKRSANANSTDLTVPVQRETPPD